MTNILNNNLNNLKLLLNNGEYWDFFIGADEKHTLNSDVFSGDCLLVHFDFNNSNSISGNTVYSLTEWNKAINSGVTLNDIGFTGVDSGLITFTKTTGDTENNVFLSAYTGSTLIISSSDTRLFLTKITGNTDSYEYPTEFIDVSGETIGNYINFCGGFYQGFYKLDGYDYEVFPNRFNKGWAAEFWLNKDDSICSGITATTLNDTYPDNKGLFLYFGTRAENKFWNCFEGLNTGSTSGCTSGATSGCTIPKEPDIKTSSGIPLCPPLIIERKITNKFLIFDRTCDGFTTDNFTGDSITVQEKLTKISNKTNKFLIFDRTCDGITTDNFTGDTMEVTELDILSDIGDNAIGFIIKEDGSVGYRSLITTGDCINNVFVTGITIEEQFSTSGLVKDNEWTHVVIRFINDITYDDCELKFKPKREGRFLFYINGKLKFITKNTNEFIARRLFEHKEKQQGVPFNISIGGGTQGLIESMTLDGPDPEDDNLSIETNFAGSFIGGISQFRFYGCDMDFCKLETNYESEKLRYGHK